MLITTVNLTSAATNDLWMVMNTSTSNTDISVSREFQKYISDPTRAYGLIDNGKDRKRASKHKWTDHEYHVQYRKYVQHKSVKISCNLTQFQEFLFCGPHEKPME